MNFIVYSKPNCVQCDQAKMLLKMKGKTFTAKQIDIGQEKLVGEEYVPLVDLKAKYPNIRMAPIITTDTGEFIGSLPELKNYLK